MPIQQVATIQLGTNLVPSNLWEVRNLALDDGKFVTLRTQYNTLTHINSVVVAVRNASGGLIGSVKTLEALTPWVSSYDYNGGYAIQLLKLSSGFMALWDSNKVGSLRAKIFDGAGLPVSGVIEITQPHSGYDGLANALVLDDGNVQIAWRAGMNLAHATLNLQTQTLSPATVDYSNVNIYGLPQISSAGLHFSTYYDPADPVKPDYNYGFLFKRDGSVVAETLPPPVSRQFRYDALFFENGRILKVSDVNGEPLARIFNPDGTPVGQAFEIASTVYSTKPPYVNSVSNDIIAYAELRDGRWVAVWNQTVNEGGTEFYYLRTRFFYTNGTAASQDITLANLDPWKPGSIYPLEPKVMELADGKLLVTMGDTTGTGTTQYIGYTFNPKIFYGAEGSDIWRGGSYYDTMHGGDGDDFLIGGGGNDRIFGDGGDDSLEGGQGKDLLDGGTGTDIARYSFSTAIKFAFDGSLPANGDVTGDKLISIEGISGSNSGNDILFGDKRHNVFLGNGGDDRLYGRAGDDWLVGGAGADLLNGGFGNDTASYLGDGPVSVGLEANSSRKGAAVGDILISIENLTGSRGGDDFLSGNSASNVLDGKGGSDRLVGWAGDDTLRGGNGNDVLSGGAGNDILLGGSGRDELSGGAGSDVLDGGSGSDLVSYFASGKVVLALDGSIKGEGAATGDTLISVENIQGSNGGSDLLVGNSVGNYIYGEGGDDVLRGLGGSDVLFGGNGNDRLEGGDGSDWASYDFEAAIILSLDGSLAPGGAARNDVLVSIENISGSQSGSDKIAGDMYANYLAGNGGDDVLFGRMGDDVLEGGDGSDRLSGGGGQDVFYYAKSLQGHDTITDFERLDVIGFGSALLDLAVGPNSYLPSGNFRSRSDNHAVDGNDYFIFRTTDHTLWFDADANGLGGPVLIARLSNGYDLHASDIYFFF